MMTVGHSTLSLESFLRAMIENEVRLLVDVRRYPGSRRHPHFAQQALFTSLAEVGIDGVWREGLGGRRTARKDSVNLGWRNDSFRGYADYMQTAEFQSNLDWLMGLEALGHVVVMCAEAVPWRCHRSLIADAVAARGEVVEDVLVKPGGSSSRKPHEMASFARVRNGGVTYPGEPVVFG